MNVLIVDDSRAIRTIIKNALAGLGHTDVREAADGLEAMAAVEVAMPGLILLDWNMPKMDGLTFLRKFRASEKATPVIMVTTEAEKSSVVEAIKAGVNNYVVKPFTPDQFNQAVTQTLAKAKAA